MIDDFLVEYYERLSKRDFTVKSETLTGSKKGKCEYLNNMKNNELMKELN
jgi:hypothetical protein